MWSCLSVRIVEVMPLSYTNEDHEIHSLTAPRLCRSGTASLPRVASCCWSSLGLLRRLINFVLPPRCRSSFFSMRMGRVLTKIGCTGGPRCTCARTMNIGSVSLLGTTAWTWDGLGVTWRIIERTSAPETRSHAAMQRAWEQYRRRMVAGQSGRWIEHATRMQTRWPHFLVSIRPPLQQPTPRPPLMALPSTIPSNPRPHLYPRLHKTQLRARVGCEPTSAAYIGTSGIGIFSVR